MRSLMTTLLVAALAAAPLGCHSHKQPLLPAVAPHTPNTSATSPASKAAPTPAGTQPAKAAPAQPDVSQEELDGGVDAPLMAP